jgi:hypothetical protein
MALAAYRNDAAGMQALWTGAANHEALLDAMARLPSTLIRAGAQDPEAVLQGLLDNLPLTDPEEHR